MGDQLVGQCGEGGLAHEHAGGGAGIGEGCDIEVFRQFAIGVVAGALGDRASLSFVAETERQVESHLGEHVERLSAQDLRSRAILERMQHDEMRHGANATSLGGSRLPLPASIAMRVASKVMTLSAYWI